MDEGIEVALRFLLFSLRLFVHRLCGTTTYFRKWVVALPDLEQKWHALPLQNGRGNATSFAANPNA